MMAEIKHKLMRTETLLDILRRCYANSRNDYRRTFEQQVLGMIVLTRYNNKTYRISDVIYDLSPSTEFETRDGPKTYIEYYRTVSIASFLSAYLFLLLPCSPSLTIIPLNIFAFSLKLLNSCTEIWLGHHRSGSTVVTRKSY